MAVQAESGFILLNDEPDVASRDPLGFEEVAANLASVVLRSRMSSPLTLGIEGGWGSGKSSLMRKLQHRLDDDDAVVTVWFNAWSTEGGSALEGLIKTVLQQVDPRIVRRVSRQENVLTAGRAASVLAGRWLGLSQVVDVVWDQVSKNARARNSLRTLMHEAIDRWRHRYERRGLDPLMVVFVDDLDRASPEQIFEVFEAIKLYLDTRGLAFVVGYDQSVISEVVLAEKKYSANVTGRQYLEKIVQVGYRITPPDDDHAMELVEWYTTASGTADLFDEAARQLMIDRNQRNPRRIKRFLNTFVLLYELDPDWRELGAKSLLDVLLLDMHFPDFMALFRAGAEGNPVDEFIEYYEAWTTALEEDTEEARARMRTVEEDLPEQYPTLARNEDFVTLVTSLQQTERWEAINLKLRRRSPEAQAVVIDEEAWEASLKKASDRFVGRVLWISDYALRDGPSGDSAVDRLTGSGWQVIFMGSDQAPGPLRVKDYPEGGWDVAVMDLSGLGDPDPIFQELSRFRDEDMADVARPVVVFTPRVTPSLRDWAQQHRFAVVRTPSELERWLAALARARFDPNLVPSEPLESAPMPKPASAQRKG